MAPSDMSQHWAHKVTERGALSIGGHCMASMCLAWSGAWCERVVVGRWIVESRPAADGPSEDVDIAGTAEFGANVHTAYPCRTSWP